MLIYQDQTGLADGMKNKCCGNDRSTKTYFNNVGEFVSKA